MPRATHILSAFDLWHCWPVPGPLSFGFCSYGGWFTPACIARGLEGCNYSIGGSKANDFASGPVSERGGEKRQFCGNLESDHGGNDISAGHPRQQTTSAAMRKPQATAAEGPWYIPTTVPPRTTSTDHHSIVAGQTKWAFDAVRLNYNAWLRKGLQLGGSGASMLSGGTRFKYLTKIHDLAQPGHDD